MKLFFYITFLLLLKCIYSQEFQREISTIEFKKNNKILENVLYGGTNNPEFQFIDIDNDSDSDLFILNSDGTFSSFISENNKLVYKEYYLTKLEIINWFYFIDIDGDNDFDVFTGSDNNQLSLWRNTGNEFIPDFVLEISPVLDSNNDPIFSESVSNPVFVDIDNDGDFDLVSGNQAGTVTFYENTGNANNFTFQFITNSWQNISIIGSKNNSRHGASSLEFGDLNNDSDYDLVWGDFFSNSLYYLENEGTPANPSIKLKSNIFPTNEDSVDTPGFNMPRLFDIDKDNDLDLFVSVLYEASVEQTIMFYERVAEKPETGYKLITIDFLNSLDVGSKSIPAFADLDGDDDLDLFIGSEKNPNGSIYFYENVGSISDPKFIFRDSIFNGIEGSLSIAPEFADIDGDGDLDLFVGKFLGEIDLYINTGTKENYSFSLPIPLKDASGNNIKFSNFVRPNLNDIDNDGDLDLLLGGFNGKVLFYKNEGTAFNYLFVEDNLLFQNIDVGEQSAPSYFDVDNDDDLDLIIGNRDGNLFVYKNVNNEYILSEEKFLSNFGGDSYPYFVDIDNDGDKDLFVGNIKGGLFFYRNIMVTSVKMDEEQILKEKAKISNYPNPFNNITMLNIDVNNSTDYELSLYNILGEEISVIFRGFMQSGINQFSLNSTGLVSGTYFIALKSQKNILSVHPITYLK